LYSSGNPELKIACSAPQNSTITLSWSREAPARSAVTLAGILTGTMPRKNRASWSVQPSLLWIAVSTLLVLTPFFALCPAFLHLAELQAHEGISQTQSPMAVNARQTPKTSVRFVM
jgi:hypothetical protein